MKNRIVLILLLLAAQYSLHAQITTAQLSLKDTTANVLYMGLDNIVVINGLAASNRVTFNGQPVTAATEAFEGRPANEHRFAIRAPQATTCTLQVFDGARLIFSKVFEVRHVDNESWELRVGSAKDTFTTVSQILSAPYAFIDCGQSQLKRKYLPYINRYQLVIMSADNVVIERKKANKKGLDGTHFDPDVKTAIKSMKKGDQLILEDVKVFVPSDGITRSLHSGRWTIK